MQTITEDTWHQYGPDEEPDEEFQVAFQPGYPGFRELDHSIAVVSTDWFLSMVVFGADSTLTFAMLPPVAGGEEATEEALRTALKPYVRKIVAGLRGEKVV